MLPIFVLVIPFMLLSFLHYFYRKMLVKPFDVTNKIVLITGASSGLGEACAKRFALGGAKVILCARNIMELNRVKEEIIQVANVNGIHHEPLVYSMDVTKPEDIENSITEIEERHGPVEVLISNAGISQRGSVSECIIDVHHSLMKINYFGQVNIVKAVLPSMMKRKDGHIISVGSVQGQIAIPFRSAYAASKHASQAFFDSLRAEVAQDNIGVTVINPGYIRTNLSKNAVSSDGSRHGILDKTTASGMHPTFVANYVFDSVLYRESEISLGDAKTTIVMYLRTVFPQLYFKLMEWRANSERKKMKKAS